jgi:thiamine transport system permease protein
MVATTHSGASSRLISAIASIPIAVSAIVLGIGIVATFNSGWLDIRGAMWLVPVMHAIVATPITFRILRASLDVITSDHRAAAATLGASPLRTIMTVDLGAVRRSALYAGIVSGCVSLGEFGATSVLARDSSRTIPIEISRLLGKPGDLNQLHGYALATLLLLIISTAMFSTGRSDA